MMMNLLGKLVLFTAAMSLVGCCCNSQDTNTALGAITGGVAGGLLGSTIGQGTGNAVAIGAGAIAGALVGGAIGHSMDSSDNTKLYDAIDANPTYKASTWINPKTGTSYTVIPTSSFVTYKGNPHCRKYRTIAVDQGQKRHMYGLACRKDNGNWETIDSEA